MIVSLQSLFPNKISSVASILINFFGEYYNVGPFDFWCTDTLAILHKYISQLGSCSTDAYLGPQWRNKHT